MKKSVTKLLAVTAALVTAACCTVGAAQPEKSVAETETAAAVEIGTADELLAFAQSVTDGSAGGYAGQTIVLTDDIDCSELAWQPIGTMDLNDMSNYSCMFQGTFDG